VQASRHSACTSVQCVIYTRLVDSGTRSKSSIADLMNMSSNADAAMRLHNDSEAEFTFLPLTLRKKRNLMYSRFQRRVDFDSEKC
jgi:hypothetical protein